MCVQTPQCCIWHTVRAHCMETIAQSQPLILPSIDPHLQDSFSNIRVHPYVGPPALFWGSVTHQHLSKGVSSRSATCLPQRHLWLVNDIDNRCHHLLNTSHVPSALHASSLSIRTTLGERYCNPHPLEVRKGLREVKELAPVTQILRSLTGRARPFNHMLYLFMCDVALPLVSCILVSSLAVTTLFTI